MLSTRTQTTITNLGDIVMPNFAKMIDAFTTLFASKIPDAVIANVKASILNVVKQTTNIVTDVKHGTYNETGFTTKMIAALEQETGVKISFEEFDQAWNAMNPSYQQFQELLNLMIQHNQQPNQQVVFISFTNPKDMRHLNEELEKNHQPYQLENGELAEIGGIKLYTTYTRKQTKAQLIEDVIKNTMRKSQTQTPLANSMNNVFSLGKACEAETPTVLYLRGVNNVNDPVLKDELDKSNASVDNKVQEYLVDTILWMKDKQKLPDILREPMVVSKRIAAYKL